MMHIKYSWELYVAEFLRADAIVLFMAEERGELFFVVVFLL
jgi:hypothetical protein